jgi:hypothetical protein
VGSNHVPCEIEGVTPLAIGDDITWSKGVRAMLDRIDSPVVLILLDDFVFQSRVNTGRIEGLLHDMARLDAALARARVVVLGTGDSAAYVRAVGATVVVPSVDAPADAPFFWTVTQGQTNDDAGGYELAPGGVAVLPAVRPGAPAGQWRVVLRGVRCNTP